MVRVHCPLAGTIFKYVLLIEIIRCYLLFTRISESHTKWNQIQIGVFESNSQDKFGH